MAKLLNFGSLPEAATYPGLRLRERKSRNLVRDQTTISEECLLTTTANVD
jgi:hypothetical protein